MNIHQQNSQLSKNQWFGGLAAATTASTVMPFSVWTFLMGADIPKVIIPTSETAAPPPKKTETVKSIPELIHAAGKRRCDAMAAKMAEAGSFVVPNAGVMKYDANSKTSLSKLRNS